MNKVCVSTDLKTRLATLAYDFCVGESFVTEKNPRASRYVIFFSDFTFYISFSVLKKMTVLAGSHVRLTTITTLEIVVAIEAFMVFYSTLKANSWETKCQKKSA